MKTIKPFLDDTGKVRQLPVKTGLRRAVLAYLVEKFSFDRDYTEKEVNAIIEDWHTFGDFFLLRRELVDEGFLCRTPDGRRYWREKTEENASTDCKV